MFSYGLLLLSHLCPHLWVLEHTGKAEILTLVYTEMYLEINSPAQLFHKDPFWHLISIAE